MVHHFTYRNGELYAENVALSHIADQVGTPFYCYCAATLTRHYDVLAHAFGDMDCLIAYALKANSNLAVLKLLADLGAGADVVSKGELIRAQKAGIAPDKIVFSGVGKTLHEMDYALETGIKCFNIESASEFEKLAALAQSKGKVAPISFRVNPDVDAGTHEKISTGRAENKFGVAWQKARDLYARAKQLNGVKVVGIDMHIGSQITKPEPFDQALRRLAELVNQLRADGHVLEHIDVGGGLGISYHGQSQHVLSPTAYAAIVRRHTQHLGCGVVLEPGRMIVGNAGVFVTQAIFIKQGDARNFVVVDGAMNDLVRPTLYNAYHDVWPVRQGDGSASAFNADMVGPVCETGDFLARNVAFKGPKEGDLFAIMSAGAYGAVMADQYNTRPLVPEVLVKGDAYSIIRRRPTYDEMLALEGFADWQK